MTARALPIRRATTNAVSPTTSSVGRPSWQKDGACRGILTDKFYSDREPETEAAAKRVCAGCPVRESCLADALERRDQYGVWGGLNAKERMLLVNKLLRRGEIKPVSPRPSPAVEKCVANRELILTRLEEGMPHEDIAAEVGVGRDALVKAIRRLRTEVALDAAGNAQEQELAA